MDDSQPTTYSVTQYAARLHVGRAKVLGWITSGELVALDVSARGSKRPQYRITAIAAERFEHARNTRSAAETTPRRRPVQPGVKQYF